MGLAGYDGGGVSGVCGVCGGERCGGEFEFELLREPLELPVPVEVAETFRRAAGRISAR